MCESNVASSGADTYIQSIKTVTLAQLLLVILGIAEWCRVRDEASTFEAVRRAAVMYRLLRAIPGRVLPSLLPLSLAPHGDWIPQRADTR